MVRDNRYNHCQAVAGHFRAAHEKMDSIADLTLKMPNKKIHVIEFVFEM